MPELGVVIDLGTSLTSGQVLHATQTIDGATSGPSNTVPATSHTEDYPNGLPQPRLWRHPLLNCGAAVLVEEAADADLLVVGHRGHGALGSTLLGSVGLRCVLHAPCPVTVVPGALAAAERLVESPPEPPS